MVQNFQVPAGTQSEVIPFPVMQQTEISQTAYFEENDSAESLEIAVTGGKTFIELTDTVEDDLTIDLAVAANVGAGSELYLKFSTDATQRTITLNDGFPGGGIEIKNTAGAEDFFLRFVHNGENYVLTAAGGTVSVQKTIYYNVQKLNIEAGEVEIEDLENYTLVVIEYTVNADLEVKVNAAGLQSGALLNISFTTGAVSKTVSFTDGFYGSVTHTFTVAESVFAQFIFNGDDFVLVAKYNYTEAQ